MSYRIFFLSKFLSDVCSWEKPTTRQALQGEDITVYGDGQQTRSFCFVDDNIEGMISLMNSRDGFTGPCNIGNPGEFTILELAEKVIEKVGGKSKIIHLEATKDDPKQRKPDLTKAKKILNYQPKTSLEDGLKFTIDWISANYK